MEKLKLFVVSFGGASPCFRLQVAKSPQEAFVRCFDGHTSTRGYDKANCRVEEVKIEGYDIQVTPSKEGT